MQPRQMILDLVPQVCRNASVITIEEKNERYEVTIAGTTGVVARCEVLRGDVEDAVTYETARVRLAHALKRCADWTVAEVRDGRG
jgi:hypothetical protein